MIFRDDDIESITNVVRFKRVDALFKDYGIEHYIAVICDKLERNVELIEYINENKHIIPQIHGWEHINYTQHHNLIREHLQLCIKKFEEVEFPKPEIWFPPWNKTDEISIFVAQELGLKVLTDKNTLTDVVQENDKVIADVVNFHYWADLDTHLLNTALRMEHNRRLKNA